MGAGLLTWNSPSTIPTYSFASNATAIPSRSRPGMWTRLARSAALPMARSLALGIPVPRFRPASVWVRRPRRSRRPPARSGRSMDNWPSTVSLAPTPTTPPLPTNATRRPPSSATNLKIISLTRARPRSHLRLPAIRPISLHPPLPAPPAARRLASRSLRARSRRLPSPPVAPPLTPLVSIVRTSPVQ